MICDGSDSRIVWNRDVTDSSNAPSWTVSGRPLMRILLRRPLFSRSSIWRKRSLIALEWSLSTRVTLPICWLVCSWVASSSSTRSRTAPRSPRSAAISVRQVC
ncbi:hypothetical protein GDO86_006131 [Hymenochirus boettgeri]|uniref:Uncharacterized protein n=1 Tax=Hymenochirus boettgeri TaxID=247094 RepID=A0A8T2J7B0_9PIPI|nr:hypothetical protein GDO86_006131 [Hymenochirus boettgeri]